MNVTSHSSLRVAGLLAGAALVLAGAPLIGADKPIPTDAFPTFESYIKISGRAPSVSGSDSAYARRFQIPQNGAYGIEALHLTKSLSKDTDMELDGHALSGSEDYLGKLSFTKSEVGSVEVGYKRFRTFYDGIGGFFPLNSNWQKLDNSELHVDRAKFWANLKIARPNQPLFEFNYMNELRNGRKDTTIWGDTDFTGIPIYSQSSLNPYSAARKIVPAYIDLNERQQTLTGLMKHTAGNTTFELEVAYNKNNSFDTRWINRYPGELKPLTAIPSSPVSIIPPVLANNPNFGFDSQGTKSKIMTYTGKFETKMSDTLTAFGGLSYQDAKADISGDREITLTVNTATGVVQAVGGFGTFSTRPPYSYKTVSGETNEQILTGNLGVTFKPEKDLMLTLALKGEKLDMDGVNLVNYLNNRIVQATGAVTPIVVAAPNTSERSEKSWVPELDVRYTGIKSVALYGTFDYRYSPGEESGTSTGVTPGSGTIIPSVSSSNDNVKLNHGHYKVGANWTVSQAVVLRGEVFYKDHTNKFSDVATAGDGYILGYEFFGTKLTAIVKPLPTLSFTTRYVGQKGKMHTVVDSGESYQSMDNKNYLFGETIDWNPNKQVYMQANINVVFATISTAYPRAGGTANDVLRNADNNYINGSLVTGFVVDKNTDAQLQYTFYRADNYNPNQIVTVPYGAGVKEFTVTAGLKHKFSDRIIGQAKLGYFESRNDTTGGNTNYHGPLAYVSLEYSL